MLNKFNFLFFLLRLYIIIIFLRLIEKFFSKKNHANQFFKSSVRNIKQVLSKNLKSNHDRRFISVARLLNENIKITNFFNLITQLKDENLSFVFWPKLNFKNQVYLVGDSHCEFYGRCSRALLDANSVAPYVLWLGPRTVLGLYFSGNVDSYNKFCFSEIEVAEEGDDVDARYFAFSIGSIDIRTLFAQLTKFGPRMSEDELMSKFEEAFRYFFQNFILAFKQKWPKSGLGIFEVVLPTHSSGDLISSEKDLKNYLRVMPYPVLGSHAERFKWSGAANQIIMTICKEMNIDFLYVNRHLEAHDKKYLTTIDSFDDMHITNQASIDAIFLKIIDRMEKINVG
jgi:hypothetical protein